MSRPRRTGTTLIRAMRFALWMQSRSSRRVSLGEIQVEFDISQETAVALRSAWLDVCRPTIPPCVGEKMADVAREHFQSSHEEMDP